MGRFGIQVGGSGPGNYREDGLGPEAEQAVEQLITTLEGQGLTVHFAAVLADEEAPATVTQIPVSPAEPSSAAAASPSSAEAAAPNVVGATTTGLLQPVVEGGAWKCDQCGLTFASPGVCNGGEYGHDPNPLRPTAEVLADPADPNAGAVKLLRGPGAPEPAAQEPAAQEPTPAATEAPAPPAWPT